MNDVQNEVRLSVALEQPEAGANRACPVLIFTQVATLATMLTALGFAVSPAATMSGDVGTPPCIPLAA